MTPAWHINDNDIPEDDLQAYVDGQLEGRRRASIEAYLAANPGEAARVAAYRAQNIGLHALFDPQPDSCIDEPAELPREVVEMARRLDTQIQTAGGGSRLCNWYAVAAGFALLLTAGTASWLTFEQSGWRQDRLVTLTEQTTQPPLQLASTNAELPAESHAGDQEIIAWLAEQPGQPPQRVPELEALGFELVDERVITATAGQPTAQLRYEDEAGQRVTLYMRADGKTDQTSFTFKRDGDSARFVWQDGQMAYSLIGSMGEQKLLRIAEAVNRSLNGATTAAETAIPGSNLEPAVQSTPAAGKVDGDTAATTLPDAGIEQKLPAPAIDPDIEKGESLPNPLPDGSELPKET